ncbi:MAG: two-component system sensor histidine kinase AlgZ [Planctomycetota bacterium]|jgi:two-component system sensor histidine kinase AlgZ
MSNNSEKALSPAQNPGYLPDFCNGEVFLRLLLVVELIAIVFALVSVGSGNLIVLIALSSLMMLWVGLSSAALLCLLNRLGCLRSHLSSTVITVAITLSMTVLITLLSFSFDGMFRFGQTAAEPVFTLLRNVAVASILIGMTLRYFYLQYESEMILQVQAQARLQALQARIRPHFLFNSMNTIASLTHDQPDLAEQAIENLSDLFRASLAAEASISLQQELELTQSYVALEALRLGDRLEFRCNMASVDDNFHLPALTLQPLVENAIYHGVEPLAEGGLVELNVTQNGGRVEISISNPLQSQAKGQRREGNQMAVENIRERLQIAFGGAASMTQSEAGSRYTVVLNMPVGGTA